MKTLWPRVNLLVNCQPFNDDCSSVNTQQTAQGEHSPCGQLFIFLGLHLLEIWEMDQISEVRPATSSASPMALQNDGEVTPVRPHYAPPSRGIHDDWDGRKLESYTPTERQKSVIEAVKSALKSNLYFTDEILKYCIDYLGVTPEQCKVGADRVQGGDVGMDCYFARDYLKHASEFAAARNSLSMLTPFVGQDLGTLVFNDFKRNTGMTVTALSDDQKEITLKGKRGRFVVTLVCTARQIENAMDRAFEKSMRKDRFNDVFKLNDIGTTETIIQ